MNGAGFQRRLGGISRGIVLLALLIVVALLLSWWLTRNHLGRLALRDPPAWVIWPQRVSASDSLGSAPAAGIERIRQARAEYTAGHFALALLTLEEHLGEHPADVDAHYYAGVAALATGSAARAQVHLEAAARDPRRRDAARFYQAQSWLLAGDREKAAAALRDCAAARGPHAMQAAEQLRRVEALPPGLRRLLPW